jgi:hypothetical protein
MWKIYDTECFPLTHYGAMQEPLLTILNSLSKLGTLLLAGQGQQFIMTEMFVKSFSFL